LILAGWSGLSQLEAQWRHEEWPQSAVTFSACQVHFRMSTDVKSAVRFPARAFHTFFALLTWNFTWFSSDLCEFWDSTDTELMQHRSCVRCDLPIKLRIMSDVYLTRWLISRKLRKPEPVRQDASSRTTRFQHLFYSRPNDPPTVSIFSISWQRSTSGEAGGCIFDFELHTIGWPLVVTCRGLTVLLPASPLSPSSYCSLCIFFIPRDLQSFHLHGPSICSFAQ
jgi:hypothetical protein